jgi:hypothetical protein
VEGYVKEPKGKVSKSLALQALQNYTFALANSFVNRWNAKSLPSSIIYLVILSIIYQRAKV